MRMRHINEVDSYGYITFYDLQGNNPCLKGFTYGWPSNKRDVEAEHHGYDSGADAGPLLGYKDIMVALSDDDRVSMEVGTDLEDLDNIEHARYFISFYGSINGFIADPSPKKIARLATDLAKYINYEPKQFYKIIKLMRSKVKEFELESLSLSNDNSSIFEAYRQGYQDAMNEVR